MARFNKALAQLMQQQGGEPQPQLDETARPGGALAELRQRIAADEYELAAPFVEAFLRNLRLLEPRHSASDIAALALGAFRFLCERHSLPFAIRAYTPNEAEHGWTSPDLTIEIAADDQSALIDSICDAVHRQGASIEVIVSAVVGVERDDTGMVRRIFPADGDHDECLVHLQVGQGANLRDLENVLRTHLDRLVRGRRDAGSLREQLDQLAARLRAQADDAEAIETAEFFDWLAENMTLAGYQQLDSAASSETRSLGAYLDPPAALSRDWSSDLAPGELVIDKTRAPDPLHPREFLDEVRLRASSGDSAFRVAGTLTARANTAPCSAIPVARKHLATLLDELGAADAPVGPSAATTIFDSLPVSLAIGVPPSAAAALIRAISAADAEPAFRAHVSQTAKGEHTWLTVSVPRQHLSRGDAERVADLIDQRIAPLLGRHLVSDDLAVARLHCVLDIATDKLRPDFVDETISQVRKLLSSWRDQPIVERGETRPAAPSAPAVAAAEPPAAGRAIEIKAHPSAPQRASVTVRLGDSAGALNRLGKLLDEFGLPILELASESDICNLEVEITDVTDFDRLQHLLHSAYTGNAEHDALCSLCHRADIDPATLVALRAMAALAEHRGIAARQEVHQVLAAHPESAATLARAFEIKFDPRLPITGEGQRRRDLEEALARLEVSVKALDRVSHQRIVRALAALLQQATRTSRYYNDDESVEFPLAIKLSAEREPGASEIFAYAGDWEGFVLRRGPAARIALRIVDEVDTLHREAERELANQRLRSPYLATEAGSGALAIKKRPPRPDIVDESVRSFFATLLDLTDALIGDSVRSNDRLVCYDDPDPYLSVIVDDYRSGVADVIAGEGRQRGYWMGDAAVTRHNSRVACEGAWSAIESFLPPTAEGESTTVVAIGKPHLLHLPPSVRLLAAFDDAEIFVDPGCDAKRSGEALQQLAKRPSSGWSDFPSDARGPGAAVFSRDAAKLDPSDEVLELLGSGDKPATPDELIRALLRVAVDLLWIRSPAAQIVADQEASPGAGPVAVACSEIGARVVAEPGAPACSRAARNQLARDGTVVHGAADDLAADLIADRVSNVDLALALANADSAPDVGTAELAAAIRGAVMELPAQHAVAIELDLDRARNDWNAIAPCIRALAATGGPGGFADMLSEGADLGLTRPQMVELRAGVGERIQSAIVGSALAEDAYLGAWIDSYFPAEIPSRLPQAIDRHPLRQEIAALAVSDRLLDVMGVGFAAHLAQAKTCSELDAVKVWCAVFIFGGAQEVWAEIEEAKNSLSREQHRQHRLRLARHLAEATRRLIDLRGRELGLDKLVDRFGSAVGELLRGWPEILPAGAQPAFQREVDKGEGLPAGVADHLARIASLADIIDICDLAIRTNAPRSTTATVFLGLGELLDLERVAAKIDATRDQDPRWGSRAADELRERLTRARRALSAEIVAQTGGRKNPLEKFAQGHSQEIAALRELQSEIEAAGTPTLAAVEILVSHLERIGHGLQRAWQR